MEDIASETVLRAWQEFREAVAWSRLWGWAVRVASNLLCGIRASVPQRRCVLGFDFEMVPARRAPVDEIELRSMVEVLEERLGVGERTTLGLLAAGVGSTSDLAALRGVSTWRVLASRARIRSAAQVLWNDS